MNNLAGPASCGKKLKTVTLPGHWGIEFQRMIKQPDEVCNEVPRVVGAVRVVETSLKS